MKRPSDRPGLHRVDVREAGQVADDRADRAPAAAARRKDVARDRAAANLERALPRQLEHLPVQEEEAGEAELADQLQLLVEPLARAALVPVGVAVPLLEGAVADPRELPDRRLAGLGEVRVAVAEVLGQVELETCRELAGALDGVAVEREALRQLARSGEDALAVAAPLRFAAVQRGAVTDRHEHVLEGGPALVVRMRIAGRDGAYVKRLGQLAQGGVAALVAALVRALELDEEALGPEGSRQRGSPVRVAHREPVPRAAGEADEPLVQLRQQRGIERRRRQLGSIPGPGMRGGQQPAQVRVPLGGLDEQRHVRAVGQRHLRAGDRPHAEGLRRVRELERAVDPVVIGQRQGLVAELRSAGRELLGQRSAVEKRIG